MTDYLEVLLEEQEQEEARQTLEWRRPALSLPVRPAAGDAGMSLSEAAQRRWSGTVQTNESVYGAAATQMRSGIVRAEENGQVWRDGTTQMEAGLFASRETAAAWAWPERSAIQPLTAEMGRLRRAVRQAGSQASRRVSYELGATDGNSSAFGPAGMLRPRAADYASLVDAAFARDARRYDGPLGLL